MPDDTTGAGPGGGGTVADGSASGRSAPARDAPSRIFRGVASFDVPEDVAHRVLTKATEDGLEAATQALPGRGTVRAEGSLASASGGRRRVRVAITVSGAAAEADWMRLAEEAFARAFLARMARAGHDARHAA